MGQRVNYTFVGLFVILLSLVLVMVAYWLTIGEHQKLYYTYLVYTNESVAGLNEQAPVKFNGVAVGYVRAIELNHDDVQQVILTLKVERDIPITEATVATLRSTGITGMRYVSLSSTKPKASSLRAKPGQRYPIIPSVPSLLVQLDATVRDLAINLKQISQSFHDVFDEENTKAIKQSLKNIAAVTQTLKNNSAAMDASLKSASRFLHNASVASEQLPSTMKNLNKTLDNVRITSKNISKTSVDVRRTMKQTRQTFVTLSQQTLPSALTLLDRLKSLSTNLNEFSKELNHNPSILIRGRAPRPVGPGEK